MYKKNLTISIKSIKCLPTAAKMKNKTQQRVRIVITNKIRLFTKYTPCTRQTRLTRFRQITTPIPSKKPSWVKTLLSSIRRAFAKKARTKNLAQAKLG